MNFELLKKGRTNDWDDDIPTSSGSNKSPSSNTKQDKENEDDLRKEIEELRAQISALQKSKGVSVPTEPKKTPKKSTKKKQHQRPKSMNFALNADGDIQPTGESVEEISNKLKPKKTVLASSDKKTPKPKVATKKPKSPSEPASPKDAPKDSVVKVDANSVQESVKSPPKEIRKSEKDQSSATPEKEGEASPKPKKTIASSTKKKHTRAAKSMDFALKDDSNETKVKSPKKEII